MVCDRSHSRSLSREVQNPKHVSRTSILLRLHYGQYDVTRLLYRESYDDVHKALARETQLKGWSRAKKIGLIVRRNPHWLDLAADWYPWMVKKVGMLRLQ